MKFLKYQNQNGLKPTLHFVVKGELLAWLDGTSGKESYPWQSLVQVFYKDVVHLKIRITLQKGKKRISLHTADVCYSGLVKKLSAK